MVSMGAAVETTATAASAPATRSIRSLAIRHLPRESGGKMPTGRYVIRRGTEWCQDGKSRVAKLSAATVLNFSVRGRRLAAVDAQSELELFNERFGQVAFGPCGHLAAIRRKR